MTTKARWIVIVLLLVVSLPTLGLEPPPTLNAKPSTEQLRRDLAERVEAKFTDKSLRQPTSTETLDHYRGYLQDVARAVLAEWSQALTRDTKGKIDKETPPAIAAKTTASAPPEGFPERVRESIADFLPLLGISMDAVSTSEDRKSVSLKANPFKFEHGAINLSASAAEPAVFTPLLEQVIEPLRDQEKKNLQAKTKDLDDVTFALAFGYTRRGVTWENSSHLYGRDFRLYQDLIDDFAKSTWDQVQAEIKALSTQQSQFRTKYLAPLQEITKSQQIWETPFSEIRQRIIAKELNYSEGDMLASLRDEAVNVEVLDRALSLPDYDALPSLIDNQPQLVFTLAQRASSQIVGPEATTLTARYEMGSRNLNTVLREYHRLTARGGLSEDQARLQAYKNVVSGRGDYRSEDKVIFSVSYKRIASYNFEHPYEQTLIDPVTGNVNPVPIHRTAKLILPQSHEWRGNFTFTRFLLTGSDPDNKTGVELPRLTISVEAVQLRDDPERQSRVIGKISYVQPASKGISIPITLTWASRSEFLKDQNRTFGAHLGITYKLGSR